MLERYPVFHRLRTAWLRLPRPRQGVTCLVAVIVLVIGYRVVTTESLPNFRDYDDVTKKKESFFGYLLPLVEDSNRRILDDRQKLLRLRADFLDGGDSAGPFDDRWIRRLAGRYGLDVAGDLSLELIDQLLRRVDIVAPSLVLAQAATESGWGTSRFARQGNNLFGMRDYSGEGLVPKGRRRSAEWTVAAYDTPKASVESFIHNLNTSERYLRLRNIRRDLRRQASIISGHALANGLMAYSEKGAAYVRSIQSMIRTQQTWPI